jgi:hypothetical protein
MGRKAALFRGTVLRFSAWLSSKALPSCEEKQQYSSEEDRFPIRCSHWLGPESISLLPHPAPLGKLFPSLTVISI